MAPGENEMVRRVVVDHVTLRVRDLEASRRFYEAALAPLGFGPVSSDEGGAAFGVEGADDFWVLAGGTPTSGVHVAFAAGDRAAVDAFHRAALRACAPSTTRATTAPSSSTPTATTSRPCITTADDPADATPWP